MLKIRSIPAPAGKPWPGRCRSAWWWVYPRACGETAPTLREAYALRGLSPRLRGNPEWTRFDGKAAGSIPAPAGKPPKKTRRHNGRSVYPRACGETNSNRSGVTFSTGLSPRLRGNRVRHQHALPLQRSIPAPAGKPSTFGKILSQATVYPRACGETRRGYSRYM